MACSISARNSPSASSLLRSAVYRAAAPDEREGAHLALGRRHRCGNRSEPPGLAPRPRDANPLTEEVADELERSAGRAKLAAG